MSTVLLVDDDFENRWALQLALETRGHHVILADNGRDALHKVDAHRPQLVITDFEMPEMDGGEFCRRLRCRGAFSHVPVVLLSGMPEPTREPLGWTVFLRKPASIDMLLDTVAMFTAARLTYAASSQAAGFPVAARWRVIDSRCWP
ncbi:response regulator [Paraburkholderia silvatlantica]|nr:response regulator [Paraburkholderia silvatlantica]